MEFKSLNSGRRSVLVTYKIVALVKRVQFSPFALKEKRENGKNSPFREKNKIGKNSFSKHFSQEVKNGKE